MPFNLKVGGAWVPGTGAKVKVGGAWNTVESIQVKVGGAWQTAFTNSISPAITATVAPNPSAFSQDVTISGFVLPVPTGGTVLIRDSGDSPVGSQTNVDTSTGAYSITIPDQAVGTYTFSVNYSGFDLYQPDSTNVTVNVGTIPTTTTLTRSAASYVYNATRVTLSGTVSPTPVTGGTVTISNLLQGTIGTATVNALNGNYSLLVPVRDVGSYTNISASYGGSGNYAPSISGTTSYSVTQASTAVTATASSNSVLAGSSVTLSGTLTTSGSALSGRVLTFQAEDTNTGLWENVGTGTTNSSGIATYNWTAYDNAQAIRAVYAGETNYTGATSDGYFVDVYTTIPTSISIARSAASYAYNGTRVTISGTVSPTPAGGTVTVKSGSTTLGSQVLSSASNGNYSIVMPIQNVGTYTVTAEFVGAGYVSSTSSSVSYSVTQAATAITNTSAFDVNEGASVTLSTTLTTGGAGFNNQTVTFQVLRKSDSVWVSAGTGTTNASGVATRTWVTNNAYTHSRATYDGGTNYQDATSTGVAFTTRGRATTTIDAAAGSSNWYFRGSIASAQQVGMNFTAPDAVSGANQYAVYRVDIAVSGINGSEGQVRACLWNQGSGGALLTAGATVNLPSRADGSTTRTAFEGTNFPAVAYTPATGYKIGFWRRGNSTTYQTQWRQNTGTGRSTYWDNSEASPGGFDQNTTYSGHSLDVIIYFEYYVKNN